MLLNRRQWLKTGTLAVMGAAVHPSLPVSASPTRLPTTPLADPIRLQNNENPYALSETAQQAIQAAMREGSLYPGSNAANELRTLIAEREGVTTDHVVLGSGSQEVLHMTALAYGLNGGEILTAHPTYGAIGSSAETIGAHVHRVPLDEDFQHDFEEMDRRTTQSVKLVFVCNPNNPTGTWHTGQRVRAFCEAVSRRAVVFVDEAYYEYVEDPAYTSMIGLVHEGHNVIVSRTFSKIHGLAGLRIGYAMARPDIAARLRTYRLGIGRNIMGLRAAIACYQDTNFVTYSRRENTAARMYTVRELETRGFRCLPSQTNFIFFALGRPIQPFRESMLERGFRVGRNFPPFLEWCRLSIGTGENMQAFMAAFDEEMGL